MECDLHTGDTVTPWIGLSLKAMAAQVQAPWAAAIIHNQGLSSIHTPCSVLELSANDRDVPQFPYPEQIFAGTDGAIPGYPFRERYSTIPAGEWVLQRFWFVVGPTSAI